ncbi:hypothetical protein NPIL_429271 [Nephila pilipes]|uniref:Uncharacterized protein n=1 Tax=Nephila pilipes TaxID=299642 RepID=A0A8X6UA11_NEPPI|nr:hypothetical protein NPIL_429271 [Nephila pilipes]
MSISPPIFCLHITCFVSPDITQSTKIDVALLGGSFGSHRRYYDQRDELSPLDRHFNPPRITVKEMVTICHVFQTIVTICSCSLEDDVAAEVGLICYCFIM